MPAIGVAVNGSAIRVIRERSGLTQKELAAKAELDQGTVSNLELGHRARCSPDVAQRIARALKAPLVSILREAEEAS